MSKQIELIQSLCLGLVLAVTVGIGCGFLVASCYEMYHEYMERRSPGPFGLQYERLRILSDGRPLIDVQQYRPQRQTNYLDIDRKPVQLTDEPEWLAGANLSASLPIFLNINRWGPEARIISVVQNLHVTEDWYFVFEDKHEGHGYFVGFDLRNRERLGYLSPQGFQDDPLTKAEQFSVDGLGMANFWDAFIINFEDTTFLRSGNKLFLIDLKAKTVRLLLDDKDVLIIGTVQNPDATRSDGESVAGPPMMFRAPRQMRQSDFLAVRTPNQVVLLDSSGERRQTFELPTELPKNSLGFHLLPDGNALLVVASGSPRDVGPAYFDYGTNLYWTTPQGEVIKRHTFSRRYGRNIQHLSDRAQACLLTLGVPAPIAGGAMSLVFTPWIDSLQYEKPYAERLSKSIQDTWPALLSLLILASGLTYLTDRRQRKYGLPRSYAWLVFVFLFGLPGYIAWLVHRPWPVRDPLPPPERTGLEVFA